MGLQMKVLGKTLMARAGEVDRKWVLLNAEGKVLGRLATRVATILMGKNRTNYTPHVEMGDYVIVVNATKVVVTGKKRTQKVYDHYTGYPGGRREMSFEKLMEKRPQEIILEAVRGMLPKNRLGDRMLTRLRVYPGAEHKQTAQKPVEIKI